jgi:O-antigen/teichoic acid export membrane protein
LDFGLKALFIISIFSHSATVLMSFAWSRRTVAFKMFSGVQVDPALLRPALVFSLLAFLGYLTIRIDLLMISLLGTSKEVGLYAVAAKVAQQGIMLRNVTATAFFPIAVKEFGRRAVSGGRLFRYSALFFAVTFTGSLVVSLWAEDLVTLLVGVDFAGAGPILAALVFYIGVSWVQLPFTTALQATHNERYSFWPMLITALLNVPLNYILYRRFGVIGIAYSTIVVASAGSLAFCVLGSIVLTRQGHLTLKRV